MSATPLPSNQAISSSCGAHISLYSLNISRCGLTAIPECGRTLKNLSFLRAEGNELATVPQWLEELPLRGLALLDNKLVEFPFLHLPQLRLLFLSSNELASLPCVVKGYPLTR